MVESSIPSLKSGKMNASSCGTFGLLVMIWAGTLAAEQPKPVFDFLNRLLDPPSMSKEGVEDLLKKGDSST
jgi:hypothetical protein